MMIPSQMAFQVKLFEYSVTIVTKRSSNWAYQPTPLPLFTAVSSSNYTSLFQLLSSRELCYSLISGALLLCGVVKLLLIKFYKNVTTRGPLLIKWCIKNRLTR